ncbi:hypothetical protein [Dolichospermum phage Dfl-JY45]
MLARPPERATGPLLPMGRGLYAPAEQLGPLRPAQGVLDGLYVRTGAGLTFGCSDGEPVIHIVRGLREIFPVSCWRDSRGQTLYLGFVVDLHIERFGLPAGAAAQEAWARQCLDAVAQHEAEAWLARRPAAGAEDVLGARKRA